MSSSSSSAAATFLWDQLHDLGDTLPYVAEAHEEEEEEEEEEEGDEAAFLALLDKETAAQRGLTSPTLSVLAQGLVRRIQEVEEEKEEEGGKAIGRDAAGGGEVSIFLLLS